MSNLTFKTYYNTVKHHGTLKNKFNTRFFNNWWYQYYLYLLRIKQQQQQQQPQQPQPQQPQPQPANNILKHTCFDINRKKHALVIGINYETDSSLLLRGCINDTDTITNILKNSYGYKDHEITVITDHTTIKPTKRELENAFQKLVENATNEGMKELFISYSGHGTFKRDTNSDEDDRQDEALVPIDCYTNGIITDDELHSKYLSKLPSDVNVFSLMDCCHSGTILDLQYKFNHNGGAYNNGSCVSQQRKKLNAKILKISGCRDNQYSADAYIDGKFCGAMTTSFEKTHTQTNDCRDLLLKMTNYLQKNKFEQRPVLTSSFLFKSNDKLLIK